MELDYHHQKVNVRVAHELPNDLDLGSSEIRKFTKKLMLEFDGEYPTAHSRVKICCFGEKLQIISCKTFHRKKTILLNFVSLSPTFLQNCG